MTEDAAKQRRCAECGTADDGRRGWTLRLDCDHELQLFCPECDRDQFGEGSPRTTGLAEKLAQRHHEFRSWAEWFVEQVSRDPRWRDMQVLSIEADASVIYSSNFLDDELEPEGSVLDSQEQLAAAMRWLAGGIKVVGSSFVAVVMPHKDAEEWRPVRYGSAAFHVLVFALGPDAAICGWEAETTQSGPVLELVPIDPATRPVYLAAIEPLKNAFAAT